MERRNYILAGNYLMLDQLYAEKKRLEQDNASLTRELNAHKAALQRVKRIAQEREQVAALKLAAIK